MTRRTAGRYASDHDYVQRVRRHHPSSLLPLLARAGAEAPPVSDPDRREDGRAGFYGPWAVLDVAWMSLAWGSELWGVPAARADVDDILWMFHDLEDPQLQLPVELMAGFLLRMGGQQFGWQEPDFPAASRPVALLQDTTPSRPGRLKVITPGWDRELFGCSLTEYVSAAQLVSAVARTSGKGRFDPQGLPGRLPGFTELTTPQALAAVVEANFATTARAVRDLAGAERRGADLPDPELRRFGFNPLRAHPVLSGFGDGYLVPSPAAVLAKASAYGIYYSGIGKFGPAFADDLGDLFEQYVGRHLRLVEGAEVHPEVSYRTGRDAVLSVDWIVVLKDLVLLVEVKSARPTAALNLGPADWSKEVTGKLAKAVVQLERTAARIKEGHPDFAHIPADRPVLGMVVTMEPYHHINSPGLRTALPRAPFPVTVASANELEEAVTVPNLGELLLAGARSPGDWSIRRSLGDRRIPENPILAEAWEQLPLTKAAVLRGR
ncbi:hypothetical protein [Kitasatospora cineracea]|uniref:hypothetical protein n=1 Tax=Kitasatospora cineracea TaxID=88074 RepID=UPI0033D5055E